MTSTTTATTKKKGGWRKLIVKSLVVDFVRCADCLAARSLRTRAGHLPRMHAELFFPGLCWFLCWALLKKTYFWNANQVAIIILIFAQFYPSRQQGVVCECVEDKISFLFYFCIQINPMWTELISHTSLYVTWKETKKNFKLNNNNKQQYKQLQCNSWTDSDLKLLVVLCAVCFCVVWRINVCILINPLGYSPSLLQTVLFILCSWRSNTSTTARVDSVV